MLRYIFENAPRKENHDGIIDSNVAGCRTEASVKKYSAKELTWDFGEVC